jgi:signal transduction histidine kinase
MTGAPADVDPDDSRRIGPVPVSDRGPGILPTDLPRLSSGSGLGPRIRRGLVAPLKLGSGAAFRFTLPLIALDQLQDS